MPERVCSYVVVFRDKEGKILWSPFDSQHDMEKLVQERMEIGASVIGIMSASEAESLVKGASAGPGEKPKG